MLFMGIDPSLDSTGWAILNATGELVASGFLAGYPDGRLVDRCMPVTTYLLMLVKKYRPFAVLRERPFMGFNADAAAKLFGLAVLIDRELLGEAKMNDLTPASIRAVVKVKDKSGALELGMAISRRRFLKVVECEDELEAIVMAEACRVLVRAGSKKITLAREGL